MARLVTPEANDVRVVLLSIPWILASSLRGTGGVVVELDPRILPLLVLAGGLLGLCFFWKASLSIELPLTAHDPIHP
jgi:hypothetical protein